LHACGSSQRGHEEIKAALFAAFGFLLCLYAVWNMKLGSQDWKAFVALGLGLISLFTA
jgi:hypothetical protein